VLDSGHGKREGVLAEGPPGQVAGGGTELHAQHTGPSVMANWLRRPPSPARHLVELAQVHGPARLLRQIPGAPSFRSVAGRKAEPNLFE